METAAARPGVTGDVTEGAHPLWLQPESHNEMFCCALKTYWPLTVKPPNYKIPALLMFSTICVFSKWKRLPSHHDISFVVAMASFLSPHPQIFVKNMPKTGSISQVLVQLPHVFQMFPSESFMDHDARWAPQSGELRPSLSSKFSSRLWVPRGPTTCCCQRRYVVSWGDNSLWWPLTSTLLIGIDSSCVSIAVYRKLKAIFLKFCTIAIRRHFQWMAWST